MRLAPHAEGAGKAYADGAIVTAVFLAIVGAIVPGSDWVGPLSYLAVAGTMGVIGLALWMGGRKAIP